MSSMAKIFVVVNLVLVVFVFGAAAMLLGASNDYKALLAEANTKASETNSTNEAQIKELELQLETQKNAAVREQARASDAEARLELFKQQADTRNRLNQQLSSTNEGLKGELAKLTTQLQNQQATVKAAQDNAKDSNEKYQDTNKKWESEVENRSQLEVRVQELDDTSRELQAQNQANEKKIRDLEFLLGRYRERYPDLAGPIAEGADGQVLEVRNVSGGGIIVILSVGRDDGVKVGDEYKVRRGSDFVGFAKVSRVSKDKAVAEFDVQFTGRGAPPRSGDQASAR